MSQAKGLMHARAPVVGLQRVDRVQPELCCPVSFRLTRLGPVTRSHFAGSSGVKRIESPLGCAPRDSETARDEEHCHHQPPPSERLNETKRALFQRLWREYSTTFSCYDRQRG